MKARFTLTAIIEQLYEEQIASLDRACRGGVDTESKAWERGEAHAYANARQKLQKLRNAGRTRIV